MRFVSLPGRGSPASPGLSREYSAERRAGHQIGVISLGAERLFFRKGLTVYVLPYAEISRYFRRVLAVPARIGCCAGGELRIEHLVLRAVDAQGAEVELAQIQLPGERAAKAIMTELGRLAPDAVAGRPSASAADASQTSADASQTSADASQTSADASQTSADASQTSADASQTSADASQTSADASQTSANASQNVPVSADASQTVAISGDPAQVIEGESA